MAWFSQLVRWARGRFRGLDWWLFLALVPLSAISLVTMNSFTGEGYFFSRQLIWLAVAVSLFFALSRFDWRFLRRSGSVVFFYLLFIFLLVLVLIFGEPVRGAKSWFDLGGFSFQPTDFMKLGVILILAKYFSRRHIEIAHVKHILISGFYGLVPFVLIFLQPDFGSALIIFLVWLGIVIFAGISKKHLLLVFGSGILAFILLWFFVLVPYQKERLVTFFHPLADIRGAGYSSFQSTIAVGSGQFLGKGVGFGTQSRLQFLPEYQTDFIFAAFAEEWGFVGVLLFCALFGLIIWRILKTALLGETNFEALFGVGVALWFMSHFVVSIGMNVGLLPVTGLSLPLMSYGGSHLLAEFAALGILQGMRSYSRAYHREDIEKEFLGWG